MLRLFNRLHRSGIYQTSIYRPNICRHGIYRHCILCHCATPGDLCMHCRNELPLILQRCLQCGIPLSHDGLCGDCLLCSPRYSQCIAPLRFEAPISHLLSAFKYQGNFNYGRVLSQILADQLPAENTQHVAALIPVPLHWRRRWQRGFNQTEIIADELSRRLKIPVQTRWLKKIRGGTSQQLLDADARKKNLLGAFNCSRNLTGMHVALVDDVVTTGATANVISEILLQHGAASVQVWAIARTP